MCFAQLDDESRHVGGVNGEIALLALACKLNLAILA